MLLNMPQHEKHRLVVSVTGLKPLKGDLYITLNQRPEYFQLPDSAFMKAIIGVKKETEKVIFDDVPPGRFAVSIYHDENLNGRMDASELGMPKEGYGFSNNPKVMGKPKFEQAAFDFSGNDTIEVRMIYHTSPKK